ncbi:hypothetical protein SmJEL517_g01311 [Synchytrium microbalum]|uniref:UspA domain-containing protein n=1 Tax=Synchytrium microbalum TaxID=1806994 RepID=A0A507CBQ1_9FUNG|nr:uncharacterized protein SmJEL517_g01311 [Synchytrium microbalum]TPX36579.1 hypothetical protein SmJEL517_g01311 [Synchytrium microbalum]
MATTADVPAPVAAVKPRVIVLALDASPQSERALNWCLEHISKDSDHLVVVTALKPVIPQTAMDFYVGTDTAALEAEVEKRCITDVKKTVAEARAKYHRHVEVTIKVVWSDPRDALMDTINQTHADMIVLGSRGRSNISGMLLGSVSNYILHHSQAPVIVVRDPSEK